MDCGGAAGTEDEGASGYTARSLEIVTDKQMPCPLCGMALDHWAKAHKRAGSQVMWTCCAL
ncbi:MAG: hypothetical protein IPL73_19870 [Candidatus Obscuribacter sp.]|nr:hypothetical protein [Candidatus Obscuribacter sp.]